MKKLVIGIDEAGRGPLAGPVAVGLVMATTKTARSFFKKRPLRDSKKMTEKEREEVFAEILKAEREGRLKWVADFSSAKLIDRVGIVRAISVAVDRNLKKLVNTNQVDRIELDGGLRVPEKFGCSRTITKGDEKIPVIALASVVAKVSRDRLMKKLAKEFPEYGFEQHKGYGTKKHYQMIKKLGVNLIHRKSFLKRLNKINEAC